MDTSLDALLRHVTRPARYTGAEWNSRTKEWDAVRLRIALAYPDLYEVGISSPGMASLYSLLGDRPDTLAERVYAPQRDMAQALRTAARPLFTVESRRPLTDFDLLLVELPRELSWTTLLTILDLGEIPLLQHNRGREDPLVVGWGAGATNPEPLAAFLDLVLLGDAEGVLPELLRTCPRRGEEDRAALLLRLARVPGVYAPSLYTPQYDAAGRLEGVQRIDSSLPLPLVPSFLPALPPAPTRPPLPVVEAIQDRSVIEIQRGCDSGCPACLAGLSTPPLRQRSAAETETALAELVRSTGHEEISLGATCLRDYEDLEGLLRSLAARCRDTQTVLTVPAVPLETVTPGLVRALVIAPRPSLNFAPEPINGSRLRGLLVGPEGAGLRDALESIADSLVTVRIALLLGHPTEGEDDWREVPPFIQGIRRLVGRKPRLRVFVTPFLPRPHTLFQRAPQPEPGSLIPRLQGLKRGVSRAGASFSAGDLEMAYIEGALARGDRRLGRVISAAWEMGSSLDTWRESFDPDIWRKAFARAGLSPDLYTRERGLDEVLPWGHPLFGSSPLAFEQR